MRIKVFISLLILPLLLAFGNSHKKQTFTHFSSSPVPTWVASPIYSVEPESIHPSQINEQILLLDSQHLLEEKTYFHHQAVKILSPTGVEDYSQLKFHFEPFYEKLVLHKIQVYRNGQWSDRMNSSTHKVLQLEDDLDSNIYNGTLCLVYFLDDIRVGDIIDFSCSFIGENPIFSTHYTQIFSLQETASIEKIYQRIVSNPSQELYVKSFNTDIEPKITRLSPTTKEWVWEVTSTLPLVEESDEPSWHIPGARVHVSQYQSWQELAQKVASHYPLSDDMKDACPPEVLSLTNSWKAETTNPIERATLALRFVQDEIRYLGFEDGIGAFKPSDPWTVFERRFGDCKDKSLLLCHLLKILDIESTPMLVHSRYGRNLPEALPSPLLFNHVVLELSINGQSYWVDSTMQLQGGSLPETHFPDYKWGLRISDSTEGLVQLPPETLTNPTEIETALVVKTPDTVEVSMESKRYGAKADSLRRYLENIGLKAYSEETLLSLKRKYGAVSALSPITVSDDRSNNVILIRESFLVPTKDRLGKKILKTNSFVLSRHLDDRIDWDRASPYAIAHPLWIWEHITIINPFGQWPHQDDELKIDHPSFHYLYSYKMEGQGAEFFYEIQHLEDHVPVDLVNEYWNAIEEIKSRNIEEVHIQAKSKK